VKKTATGKPPRKQRAPRKPKPLPPFDERLRSTVEQTQGYLNTSRPTVYKLINAGLLEAFKEGRRTYITGRSIAARMLPPA
jgi:excisionase family DNA binding protein